LDQTNIDVKVQTIKPAGWPHAVRIPHSTDDDGE
jgi:hypothetical protein